MGNAAARLGASNLDERLPVPNSRNELGRLAATFNDLLARLAQSFEQQRRFMSDASHELRTPVAIVCGESEVALSQPDRSPAEYRESLSILHDEGRRLTRIVEDLFFLTRADAGQYHLVAGNFYLDEMVGDCLRAMRSLATARKLELQFSYAEDELAMRGDEALIRRMILNLLDNAIKYTPPAGQVIVDLQRCDDDYAIRITDTGQGIPAESQAHIFDRFYRADTARGRNGDADGAGAGLGLAISRWVAELHGGRILLERSDERGTTFFVCLPSSLSTIQSAVMDNSWCAG
jgi:two-component system, OmpR family, sensor kinase